MKRRIFIVLLAVLIAVLPVALLCSCNGCSSKTVSAPEEVQGSAAAQVKPAPTVEKVIVPEVQPAEVEAAPVAEETAPAETVAEAVVEPEVEEESAFAEESAPAAVAPAPTAETEEPAEAASTGEPAEEPVVEKAPAQEAAQPEAESEEPAPAAAEPVAETASEPAEESAAEGCGSHILTLGISPWGWQHFHIDESGIDDKNSTYGLGDKLAYTYLFDSGFYVGAEAAYETYFIDHKDNFHDIMFFVDGGYNFGLGEKLGLYVGLGGGLELECYEDECSAAGLVKGDLGLGYSLSEHWILGAGCDFIVGFPMKSDINYIGFQIVPSITVSYTF